MGSNSKSATKTSKSTKIKPKSVASTTPKTAATKTHKVTKTKTGHVTGTTKGNKKSKHSKLGEGKKDTKDGEAKGTSPTRETNQSQRQSHSQRLPGNLKVPRARAMKASSSLLKHMQAHAEKQVKSHGKKQYADESGLLLLKKSEPTDSSTAVDDDDDENEDEDEDSERARSVLHMMAGEPIFVTFGLSYTPTLRTFKGKPIELPHPLYPDQRDLRICLLVKDKQEMKKLLLGGTASTGTGTGTGTGLDINIPGLEKIIGLQQLRTRYTTFESKRKLVSSYDVFIADDRIVCMLPKTLGKAFYEGKTAKIPVPIRMAIKNKLNNGISDKISKALRCSYLYLSGSCCTVRVGNAAFTEKELAENVLEVVHGGANVVPHKWKGIQSIHLKGASTAALPLYADAPSVEVIDSINAAEKGSGTESKKGPAQTKSQDNNPNRMVKRLQREFVKENRVPYSPNSEKVQRTNGIATEKGNSPGSSKRKRDHDIADGTELKNGGGKGSSSNNNNNDDDDNGDSEVNRNRLQGGVEARTTEEQKRKRGKKKGGMGSEVHVAKQNKTQSNVVNTSVSEPKHEREAGNAKAAAKTTANATEKAKRSSTSKTESASKPKDSVKKNKKAKNNKQQYVAKVVSPKS